MYVQLPPYSSRLVFAILTLFFIGILSVETSANQPPGGRDTSTDRGTSGEAEAELRRESPASLLETEIGDSSVDLFVLGSWTVRAGIAAGMATVGGDEPTSGLTPGRLTAQPFPAFGPGGFRFANIVDLTLSLRLDDRYFFETSFVDDFELNSILFGYDGREEDTLQSLRVGYGPISIEPYPFMPAGESVGNTLGASARLVGEVSKHDLMARYEPTALESVRYRGRRLLEEERIDPATYTRDRRFLLPDSGVNDLRLYRERSTAGSGTVSDQHGRHYEEIDISAESAVSLARGTVTLDEPADGRLVATYTVDGVPVGSEEGMGSDFLVPVAANGRLRSGPLLDANSPAFPNDDDDSDDEYSVYLERIGRKSADEIFFEIDGRPGVLLYEPGYFSPFSRNDSYEVRELDATADEIAVEYLKSGGRTEADIPVRPPARPTRDGDALVLGGTDPRALENRYPFGVDSPLYGPGARARGEESSFDIVLETGSEVDTISLPGNVVPGTVELRRNGVLETRFTVAPGGSVDLGFDPAAGDMLEFRYRTFDRGSPGGEAVLVSANRFTLSERDELTVSMGSRWDLSDRGYTSRSAEADGRVTGAIGYEHSGERLETFMRAAGTFSVPDTTGARRLFGMQERSVSVPLPPHRLLPGARPDAFTWIDIDTDTSPSDDSSGGTLDLSGNNGDPPRRGSLLFRDYRDGEQLLPYDSELDEERVFDYEPGAPVGPYSALDPGRGDTMAAFEFDLDEREWVAGQIQIAPALLPAETEGVRFDWKAVEPADGGSFEGEVDIYVQFGATAEDLDGDGRLDEGTSALRPAFEFNDENAGFALRAGGLPVRDGSPATEDGTETGYLAAEDVDRIASRRVASGVNGATTGRESVTIAFTESERRKIADGRALRIVIVESNSGIGGATARGRILVGGVELLGTPLLAQVVEPDGNGEFVVSPDDMTVSAGEISEADARDMDGNRPQRLSNSFPDSRRFGTDEDGQRVLRVQYHDNGDTFGGIVRLRGITEPVTLREYRELIAYVHTGDAGPLTLDVEYGDGVHNGIQAYEIPVDPGTEWQEVRIALNSREISVNGETTGVVAEIDPAIDATQFDLFVRTDAEGGDSGTYYFDEIHLAGTRPSVSATLEAGARYRYAGEIARIGSLATIADLDAGVRSRLDADLSAGHVSALSADSDIAATIARVRVGMEIGFTYAPVFDELSMYAGHRMRIPTGDTPLWLEERYSRTFATASSARETRDVSMSLDTVPLKAKASSASALSAERLRQRWSFNATSPAPGVSLEFEMGLVSEEYRLPVDDGYFVSWLLSHRLLTPYRSTLALERSARARIERSAGDAAVSATGKARVGFRTFAPAGEQRSEAEIEFGTLFRPDRSPSPEAEAEPRTPLFAGLSLEPFYRRRLRLEERYETETGFGGDYRRYGSALAEEKYLYTSAPFLELFQPLDESRFAQIDGGRESAEYRPAIGLRAQRNFGSRLRDLLIPFRLEGDYGRRYERRDDSLRVRSDAQVSTTTLAVNLFGRLGAYPITDLYASDEFFGRITGQALFGDENEYRATWETAARFFSGNDSALELENTYSASYTQMMDHENESEIEYSWTSPAHFADSVPWPFDYETAQLRHREHLALLLARPSGDRTPARTRLLTGHRSTLELDDIAGIDIHARVGWEREHGGEQPPIDRFGIEVGMEARFRF